MTSIAGYLPEGRHDIARWGICFAIVLGAHGAAALALLQSPEDLDFGVDEPVVMLDLPESLAPVDSPLRDLAPGPLVEEESEPTPPQKEETKPPETESEIALPEPEPPKPDPPVQEKLATAPQATRAPQTVVVKWESLLAAHIDRYKRYPMEARLKGETGVAQVFFTIDHEGHLLSSRIVRSSGSATLDQETLAMLERAQPMPRPPSNFSDSQLSFIVPIRFNLR
jgi:periplasmic protein TonB